MSTIEERVREIVGTATDKAVLVHSTGVVHKEINRRLDALEERTPSATAQAEDVEALARRLLLVENDMGGQERGLDNLEDRTGALEERVSSDILTLARFLGDQDKRIEKLEEAKPILHERDERGHWICCCGDSLEEPPPLVEPDDPQPKPAPSTEPSELVKMVRDEAIRSVRTETPSHYANRAVRAFANWLDAEAVVARVAHDFINADIYARTAKHVRAQLDP